MTTDAYWQRWSAAGLASGPAPAAAATDDGPGPWYIRVILGICGWLGGLLLLIFLGFAWLSAMQDTALGVLGLVLVAAAYAIYRLAKSELGEQFALALSLAGQAALAFSLFAGATFTHGWAMIAIGGLQLALLWLIPNALHRAMSTLFALTAIDLAFYVWAYPSPVPAVATWLTAILWMDESRWQRRLGARYAPIASGVTLAALLGLAPLIFAELRPFIQVGGDVIPDYPWLLDRVERGLGALVWVWVVWRGVGRAPWHLRAPAWGLGLLMAVASGWMPGVALGLLVLLLGFARGKSVLLGLGATAGLVHLSLFYYSLSSSLLVKSISLMALGGLLLLAAWVLPRLWPEVRDV